MLRLFSVSVHPVAGDPVKWTLGKRAAVAQEGKGNAGAGSQSGQGVCRPQGWAWGAPLSQDGSFPVLETCCVF